MEAINQTVSEIQQNQQIETSSTKAQISLTIPKISRDQYLAIFAVINLSRGTLGWTLKEAGELREQINIWAVTFNDYKIPNEHLPELWKRARDLRIARLQAGQECPDFTAELLAACWIGENGLKKELENQAVSSHKFLKENAESICQLCFSTKMEFVQGKGVRPCSNCAPDKFAAWQQRNGIQD